MNQILYGATGLDDRRDPYSFYASGNVSMNLYGWSVPLSFAYSNQQFSFQQPFNQYALHPTYKWVTGHIGYANMNFSSYTLAGHTFLGTGVEATPGNWTVGMMYGRLLQAVQPDSLSEDAAEPAYRRMGYGLKAGYHQGNDQLQFIFFRAQDELNSIDYVPEADGILPQQNLVLSAMGSKQLLEKFVISGEYAISGLNRDIRSDALQNPEAYKLFAHVGPLYTPRTSSSYYSAMKSAFSYQGSAFTVGLGYERIDPGYETLGAYFFNNDLENITVNGATAFFGGRVNVAANVGRQRDNLDGDKASALRRTVGSVNVGLAASERLNMQASYSNFTTFTNIRSQFVDINQLTPYDNLDTLNFTQISQNASLNATYQLSTNKERSQNLSMNLSFQDAADNQGGVEQPSGSQFYMATTSYSLSVPARNIGASASFNYNQNRAAGQVATTLGPTVSLNKTMLEKKLRTSLSTSWNGSLSEGEWRSRVMNVRLNGGFAVQNKHNLNLSVALVNRASLAESGLEGFTEVTGTLGYSYSFSTK